MVNEALTFAGPGAGTVTAKVTQNGWAWVIYQQLSLYLVQQSVRLPFQVVQGRRLLIWQYKDTAKSGSPPRVGKLARRGGGLAQCRELTLPYSDLGHKSDLISVFQTEGQQMASCIASISHGRSSVLVIDCARWELRGSFHLNWPRVCPAAQSTNAAGLPSRYNHLQSGIPASRTDQRTLHTSP